MKIFSHVMHNSIHEAQNEIKEFKHCHPKSKKKFKIVKQVFWIIEEE